MNCPYCENEMVEGKILGDRYMLKWMPADKKKTLGIFANNSINVGSKGGLVGRPYAVASYCKECNKMVVDVE